MCTCNKEYLGTCDECSCDDPNNYWDEEDDMVGDDIDNKGYSSTCSSGSGCGSSYDCCDDDDDWLMGGVDDDNDCHHSDCSSGSCDSSHDCCDDDEDWWMSGADDDSGCHCSDGGSSNCGSSRDCCDDGCDDWHMSGVDDSDCHCSDWGSSCDCHEDNWQDTPPDNNEWCENTGNDDVCSCTDCNGDYTCSSCAPSQGGNGYLCPDNDEMFPEDWTDNDEGREPEQYLQIEAETLVYKAGMKTYILLKTCPCGESVRELATWHSSDASIVWVDQKGNITTMKDGTAIITATYNGVTASCKVIVDSRPLVRVTQLRDYFSIEFAEHKPEEPRIWKSVGCDLNLPENRSGYDIWNEDEDLLLPAERNYKYNCGYDYTYDQLALLYRLDPFGVILYVKNYAQSHYGGDIKNQLIYKDNVYIAIFGYDVKGFYFKKCVL